MAPNVCRKSNEDLFGEILAKILRTPKNLLAPTPMSALDGLRCNCNISCDLRVCFFPILSENEAVHHFKS